MQKCSYCGRDFKLKFGESCLFYDKPFCSEKCREQFCSLPLIKRKKRSFKIKCFGLLSVFAIIFGYSLSACLDVSALRHEYAGINFYQTAVPNTIYNSSTGRYELDTYDNNGIYTNVGGDFRLRWEGGAYQSEYDSLSMKKDTATMSLVYDSESGKCAYTDVWAENGFVRGIYNTLAWQDYSGNSFYGIGTTYGGIPSINPDWLANSNSDYGCRIRSEFGDGKPQFDETSLPTGNNAILSCDRLNGLTCGHLEFIGNIVHNDIEPYFYSADGFYIHNSVVDSNGVSYSNSFSFYDMFNGGIASKAYIPTFSELHIPMDSDYFLRSGNLTFNRQIEFSGAFEFDGSFSWNPDINNNGSSWYIDAMLYSSTTGDFDLVTFDCTANVVAVGDAKTQLLYSCPYTLTDDYLLGSFTMVIDGNNDYVWETDAEWRFYYNYFTTDNDTTPGESFNTDITGNSANIIGSASDNVPSDGGASDFLESLTNLFNFSFTNPFAPIFGLFTSGSQCVDIPIIAGMLGSTETQYCSWFPSSVKTVLTPVLGLSSMMLVFGFLVHWLGSSSGNLFEDAGSHTSGGIHVTTKGGK